MPDIFLSYSREDAATARRFADGFEREGFGVWWDATLRSGDAYDQVTEQALKEARAVVVLWSKTSCESRWVRAEATLADRSRTLVPAMIEPCDRPIMFELTQTADLTGWSGDPDASEWRAFVDDVRGFVHGGAPAPAPAQPRTGAPAASAKMQASRWPWIAACVAALIVAAVAVIFLRGSSHTSAAPTAASTGAQAVSLAVLPFVNMSSDKEQEYFSDGLSEELLNQLAQIKDLRVAGRTSSFSFKGRNGDLRTIGEQLGVSNILEGSVRKDGDRLRITAQLIDARTGSHRWSKTFDRELKSVFEIQEEIAMAVSGALSVALDVGDMSRARGGTTNLDAYDKYLRAKATVSASGAQALIDGAAFYREAVALDPTFVSAWRELYEALAQQVIYVPGVVAAARKEMADVTAQMEALAPNAWQTHATRSMQFADTREWLRAESELQAAQRAMPSSHVSADRFEVWLLFALGRPNEAVPLLERACTDDPLSLAASYQLQVAYQASGRVEEALREYERSKGIRGDRSLIEGVAALSLSSTAAAKQTGEAREALRTVMRENVPAAIFQLYTDLADRLDKPAEALLVLRRTIDDPAQKVSAVLTLASHFADYFGDADLALKGYRRAYIELEGSNSGLLWQPSPSSIRTDARFKGIARDMKLVDYWRASGNWGEYCHPVGSDDFECR